MILRFKQRFFSWFDSYDIYDENGNTVYVVKGQLSWGHCLKIFDAYGEEIGTVKERIFTLEWDYTVVSGSGHDVASISKELFNWTDTYLLNIYDPADALCVLMIVLAIDAEKCSRNNG